ncbi:MAG TPA: mechanosensitive ion channel domain-containing protein [Terriglobia bacterium]|nr:mechanosensitive ion channel domain-containing protein [Terriglobia bacterium]
MEMDIEGWITNPAVRKLLDFAIGMAVIGIATVLLRRTAEKYIVKSTDRYKVRKFITLAAYLVAVLLIFDIYSGRWGVAIGVASAGVALALKDVITSVAGWVGISAGGFYKTGDRIQLAGIRGDVIDVGVFKTTLMEIGQWVKGDLYNGRIVRISNNLVFTETIFNYSADFPFVWDEFTLPVKYGSDLLLAQEILNRVCNEVIETYVTLAKDKWNEVARKYLVEETELEPMVTMRATDNWVEFTIRYIVDYKRRRVTENELFRRILDELQKTNDRVQIASGTYAVVQVPPLQVSIRDRQTT